MILFNRYGRRGKMVRSRKLAKALAQFNGYFWLPCPLCRNYFAGFETYAEGLAITVDGMTGVCSRAPCKEEGARQRTSFYADFTPPFIDKLMGGNGD